MLYTITNTFEFPFDILSKVYNYVNTYDYVRQ